MSTRKFETIFTTLAHFRAVVKGPRTAEIKRFLGDSINNNRSLTINQMVRYCNKVNLKRLAQAIEITTNILKNDIKANRGNRNDAFAFNELINTFRIEVMNKKRHRNRIGNSIARIK